LLHRHKPEFSRTKTPSGGSKGPAGGKSELTEKNKDAREKKETVIGRRPGEYFVRPTSLPGGRMGGGNVMCPPVWRTSTYLKTEGDKGKNA